MADFPHAADSPDESAATPTDAGLDAPQDETALLLSEHDFLPERPRKLPGPGLLESLGWVAGLIAVQIAGVVLGTLLATLVQAARTGPEELAKSLQNPQAMQQVLGGGTSLLILFCVTQLIVLWTAIAAAMLRLGRNRRRFLPLTPVPLPHAVVVGLLIFPLMVLSEPLYRIAMEYWEWFLSYFPALQWMSENNSMEVIGQLAPSASLPLLLFLIAFVPAVAEELVFRGVIGRGLVARWGLPAGIVMTSLLFAAVHLHPAHAFALLPLAICIHLAYLSTRSFWVPMAIHFVNNAFAVVMLKLAPDNADLISQTESAGPSTPVYAAAAAFIALLAALLWQIRIQFRQPDGTHWDPGYRAAELPPAGLVVERQYALPNLWLLAAAAIAGILFVAAYFQVGFPAAAGAA